MRAQKIAVVGGGIAGLYGALRLKELRPEYHVTVFEAQNRVGGRILSVRFKGIPFAAELGAMRFQKGHILLDRLVRQLQLPHEDFRVRPPVFRLRGRTFTEEDIRTGACNRCGASIPYALRPDEQGLTPGELIASVIRKLAGELTLNYIPSQRDALRLKDKLREDPLSVRQWKAIGSRACVAGVPLNRIGFLNLLHHYLSSEAVSLVRDSVSLRSVSGNWNAADAIPWFLADMSHSDLYMFPAGSDSLPRAMENQCGALGIDIKLSTPVERIEARESGYTLLSATDNLGDFDQVIMALPRGALGRITVDASCVWPPPWFTSVSKNSLFKAFLVYESPWWIGETIPNAAVGRVYTDGPLRQVYYFAERSLAKLANREESNSTRSMILASYSDEQFIGFWEPTMRDDRPVGEQYFEDPTSLPAGVKIAGQRLLSKLEQQLREIHQGLAIPPALAGCYINWGARPYDGGWHTWRVGEDEPFFRHPCPDLPQGLWVCGEAYSFEQGWIEGALRSTERVLSRIVGRGDWRPLGGVSEGSLPIDYFEPV